MLPVQMSPRLAGVGGEAGEVPRIGARAGGNRLHPNVLP